MSSSKLITSDDLLICNACGAQYDGDEKTGKDECRICEVCTLHSKKTRTSKSAISCVEAEQCIDSLSARCRTLANSSPPQANPSPPSANSSPQANTRMYSSSASIMIPLWRFIRSRRYYGHCDLLTQMLTVPVHARLTLLPNSSASAKAHA